MWLGCISSGHKGVLGNLPLNARQDFDELVRSLEKRFFPSNQTELYRTQLRVAKEQFIAGLASADMRLRVKQERPLNLSDAVRHAVELEGFNKAERKHDEGRGYLRSTSQTNKTQECDSQTLTLIKSMQTMLSELQQEVKSLKDERQYKTSAYKQNDLSKTKCCSCGSLGHIVGKGMQVELRALLEISNPSRLKPMKIRHMVQ